MFLTFHYIDHSTFAGRRALNLSDFDGETSGEGARTGCHYQVDGIAGRNVAVDVH